MLLFGPIFLFGSILWLRKFRTWVLTTKLVSFSTVLGFVVSGCACVLAGESLRPINGIDANYDVLLGMMYCAAGPWFGLIAGAFSAGHRADMQESAQRRL
jgi:hypothetical protein